MRKIVIEQYDSPNLKKTALKLTVDGEQFEMDLAEFTDALRLNPQLHLCEHLNAIKPDDVEAFAEEEIEAALPNHYTLHAPQAPE